MPEFNPATDLPTTAEQLDQVQAVAVAEFEWDKIGGKIVDRILRRELSPIAAADTLSDRYGVTRTFWHRHLLGVLEDNGVMQTGCPVCGTKILSVDASRPVTVTLKFEGDLFKELATVDAQITWSDSSNTVCTGCSFSGQLGEFKFLPGTKGDS